MINRKRFLKGAAIAVLTLVTGGALLAQIGPGGPFGHRPDPQRMLRMLSDYLDLTPSQQELAKSTMEAARKANEPVVEQLKQIAETGRTAVKGGKSETELRAIANSAGPLVSQLAFNHMVAMSKLYPTLSQPQKDKLERLREHMDERFGLRAHGGE
ncbi:MAG: Spy/CpxP family protein refolding chaperone [Bryobacterales bacterium]|nr:Spy/CpxP family protein refolding chaperone [Bryobacterales bacterium]